MTRDELRARIALLRANHQRGQIQRLERRLRELAHEELRRETAPKWRAA